MPRVRYTLNDIETQRAEMRVRLQEQEQALKAQIQAIAKPQHQQSGKLGTFLRIAERAVLVYQGVSTGMRFVNSVKGILPGKRRRR